MLLSKTSNFHASQYPKPQISMLLSKTSNFPASQYPKPQISMLLSKTLNFHASQWNLKFPCFFVLKQTRTWSLHQWILWWTHIQKRSPPLTMNTSHFALHRCMVHWSKTKGINGYSVYNKTEAPLHWQQVLHMAQVWLLLMPVETIIQKR